MVPAERPPARDAEPALLGRERAAALRARERHDVRSRDGHAPSRYRGTFARSTSACTTHVVLRALVPATRIHVRWSSAHGPRTVPPDHRWCVTDEPGRAIEEVGG